MAKEGANAVTIEELDGQMRHVALRGPGMPHQGVSWKTEQRVSTEWYPGNPQEATQQIFGPTDAPTTMAGTWRLTMMLRTPSIYTEDGVGPRLISHPATMCDILDSIFYGGQKLRVTWLSEDYTGEARSISREGRAKSWDWKYDRIEDVEWTIEWEWSGRGAALQKVSTARDDAYASLFAQTQAAANTVLNQIMTDRIRRAKKDVHASASYLSLGQLENLANAPLAIADNFGRVINAQMNTLTRVGKLITGGTGRVAAVMNSAVNTARNLVYQCNQFHDMMSRRPPEVNSLSNNVSDLVRNARYLGKSTEAQRDLARAARDLALSLQAKTAAIGGMRSEAVSLQQRATTTPRTVLGIHVVRAGDTLQSISQKWYGSPDYNVLLRRTNKIHRRTIILSPGRTLVIPALTNRQ